MNVAAGNGGDLGLEMLAYAAAMPWRAAALLEAMGVPARTIANLCAGGDLGVAACTVTRGRWVPEGAENRLVVAVRDLAGDIVDIVAIRSADEDSWAVRTGEEWALGAAAFHTRAHIEQAGPLRIFGTPLAWLKADRDGVCVLDWNAVSIAALRGLGPAVTLVAENAAAAEALRETLRWRGLPGVEVFGRGPEQRRWRAEERAADDRAERDAQEIEDLRRIREADSWDAMAEDML